MERKLTIKQGIKKYLLIHKSGTSDEIFKYLHKLDYEGKLKGLSVISRYAGASIISKKIKVDTALTQMVKNKRIIKVGNKYKLK